MSDFLGIFLDFGGLLGDFLDFLFSLFFHILGSALNIFLDFGGLLGDVLGSAFSISFDFSSFA